MDYVQVFNDELQSVLRTKPSISRAKMIQITRAAMKGVKSYKHIVQAVEKFISRSRPEYLIPGLYVIDSLVRQSRHQFGPDRDVYTARFSRNIATTFETVLDNCLPDDKPKIMRLLNLWLKNGVFDAQIVQGLLDMATNTGSSSDGSRRAPPKSPDEIDGGSGPSRSSKSSFHQPNSNSNGNGLKFNKDLLDFDYDEDDEDDGGDGDETPTEAEPPLSSTLGKIKKPYQANNSPDNNKTQSNHDAVLERWHRIVNNKHHQSTSSSDSKDQSGSVVESSRNGRRSRSRSRSPQRSSVDVKSTVAEAKPTTSKQQNSKKSEQEQEHEQDNKSFIFQALAAREAERAAERERRCLPKIRDRHLTVCSSTLWLGHLPKSLSEVDISDAFGEYGTINSIDLVPPRGCAYLCMDRRQDAKKALDESRDVKLKNSYIKMAWAPGKGFKEYKKLKEFWESDVGASFIPYSKIDDSIDFDTLEEGGVIDEDSMSIELRERREHQAKEKKANKDRAVPQAGLGLPLPPIALVNQPPPPPSSIQAFSMPPPNLSVPPPPLIPFPPPGTTTTSSGGTHMTLPPPPTSVAAMQFLGASGGQNTIRDASNLDKQENPNSSIDQQLSMTEQQISMVEQQLSMIQQGVGRIRLPPPVSMQQPPGQQHLPHNMQVFASQPNPMMFDLAIAQQLMHGAGGILHDPSISMFAAPPPHHLTMDLQHHQHQQQMMIPTSLASHHPEMPNGLNENREGF